jgi:hypothetical protein
LVEPTLACALGWDGDRSRRSEITSEPFADARSVLGFKLRQLRMSMCIRFCFTGRQRFVGVRVRMWGTALFVACAASARRARSR